MKIYFSEIAEKAEPASLEKLFKKLKSEKPSTETVSRIRKKVLGEEYEERGRRGLSRLAPAIAVLCTALALTAVFASRRLGKNGVQQSVSADPTAHIDLTPAPGESAEPAPGESAEPSSGWVQISPLETLPCGDSLSSKGALSGGRMTDGSGLGSDRLLYGGIAFFRSSGKTYAILSEGRGVYEFDGDSFTKIGIVPPPSAFFTEGSLDGFLYIGGDYVCVPVHEQGLFKFDLATGKLEKYIDSGDVAVDTAIVGSKLYYISLTFEKEAGEVYTVKCADLDTGVIKALYSVKDSWIGRLRVFDGEVYFSTENAVCRIGGDERLYSIKTGANDDIMDYAVFDGKLLVFRFTIELHEEEESRVQSIYEYDENGRLLASVSDKEKRFFGDTCDRLAIYNGRIAAFDENGAYLLDISTGEYEKIASIEQITGVSAPGYWIMNEISKTVFNGKLYFRFGGRITEYGPEGIRTFIADD